MLNSLKFDKYVFIFAESQQKYRAQLEREGVRDDDVLDAEEIGASSGDDDGDMDDLGMYIYQ